MTALQKAETSLEWWDETGVPDARAAALAAPADIGLANLLTQALEMRERAYTKASDAYARECDDDYRAQWASWAYGPDVNPAL